MYSYNVEQARCDNHNIIPVVMNEKGVDLDGALDWVATTYEQVLSRFQAQIRMLPSWGPDIDPVVSEFIERVCHWIRGHDCWSFESERYFGTKGLEIQELRSMILLPRVYEPNATLIKA
jgi:Delta6-protoilludene synthase